MSESQPGERHVLLGVVEQELPGMPETEDDARPFDQAIETLRAAHAIVREKIEELVRARTAVNDEIKLLRAEDELLTRMVKVAEAKT